LAATRSSVDTIGGCADTGDRTDTSRGVGLLWRAERLVSAGVTDLPQALE